MIHIPSQYKAANGKTIILVAADEQNNSYSGAAAGEERFLTFNAATLDCLEDSAYNLVEWLRPSPYGR